LSKRFVTVEELIACLSQYPGDTGVVVSVGDERDEHVWNVLPGWWDGRTWHAHEDRPEGHPPCLVIDTNSVAPQHVLHRATADEV
jgi:hypothetical protein